VIPDEPGLTRLAAAALLRQALRDGPVRAGPHLAVRPADGVARAVALGEELTVGRGPAAGLRLDDAGSSRLHLRLRLSGSGEATVEDLGSKNGLRLNGRALGPGPAPLRPGDELLVGATRLRFVDPLAEIGGAPRPEPTSGAWPEGPHPGPARAWLALASAALLLAMAAAALGAA
jgi:pSer/pThr/pTyr-binding forkhead associated (FHA) protein